MIPPPLGHHTQPYATFNQPPNIFPSPGYSSVSPYMPSNSPYPSPYRTSPYRSPERSNINIPAVNSKKSEPIT